jgi:sterol desaturase/sphingolipid hydroxylase (fatty acid hydroxylase superfamily)
MDVREGESNLSNFFPWWDFLFATYRAQPAAGQYGMEFGVRGFEARKHQSLPWMLAQPFLRPDRPGSPAEQIAPPVPAGANEAQRS